MLAPLVHFTLYGPKLRLKVSTRAEEAIYLSPDTRKRTHWPLYRAPRRGITDCIKLEPLSALFYSSAIEKYS